MARPNAFNALTVSCAGALGLVDRGDEAVRSAFACND